MSKELINAIWNNSESPTSLRTAKSSLENHWEECFQNELPLILADQRISNNPNYPTSLCSSFVSFDNHSEILGDGCIEDFREPSNVKRIAKFATERHDGVIHKLGYNPMVNMSVVKHNPNKMTFIGKTDGSRHFGYGVTDFDNVSWTEQSSIGHNNVPLRQGGNFIKRFLPLLQILAVNYNTATRLQALKKSIHEFSLNRQSFKDEIQQKKLLDLMDIKSNFFNSYINFLNHENEIQYYLSKESNSQKKRQRTNSPDQEHPIQSRGTNFKPIFSTLVQDINSDLNQNKTDFDTLKERYQILSDQLSQDTNLLLSTKNTSLQSKIGSLTNVLVVLTILLLLIGIIDVTPGWMLSNFYNFVFYLIIKFMIAPF